MNSEFVPDTIPEIEGLLSVNRDFSKKQFGNLKWFPSLPKGRPATASDGTKAHSAAPTNCTVFP